MINRASKINQFFVMPIRIYIKYSDTQILIGIQNLTMTCQVDINFQYVLILDWQLLYNISLFDQ